MTSSSCRLILARAVATVLLSCTFLTASSFAQTKSETNSAKKEFAIPAGDAGTGLKQFAQQSGVELLYSAEMVAGVPTKSVQGIFTPRQALDRMLDGTGLVATQGKNSGGFAVRKETEAESKNALGRPASDRAASTEGKVVELPTFEVMGSKLLNMDIRRSRDDAQPYVIFGRESIETSGATNLEDFLKTRLTMNSIGTTNSQSTSILGAVGQVNMRGLGTGQTLILIDGRRAASGAIAVPSQSDINGVPLAAIERIEVLPTTASGIYGGAATGGVINIVLRRDYAGTELQTTYQNTFDTDSAMVQASLAAGFTLEGGRTNILMAASWSDRNRLAVQDRDFLEKGRARILTNNPDFYLNAINPPLGSTTNIRSANGSPLFGPGTPNITHVPVGYAGGGGLAPLQANAGRYNFAPAANASFNDGKLQSLVNEPEIYSASLTARRQFSELVQGFIELSLTESTGRFYSNSVINNYTIPATAPNNPFGQAIRVTVPINQGDKTSTAENDKQRIVAGIIIKLPWENWQVGADYSWERTEGSYNLAWFSGTEGVAIASGAIDVLRDLDRFPGDFSPYLVPTTLSRRMVDAHAGTVRISGPVGRLPGGVPTLSALVEYRDEKYGDAIRATGSQGTYLPARSQAITSGYIETKLPLVSAKRTFLNQLELQLAGRWDDYTVQGTTGSLPVGSTAPIVTQTNRNQSLNPTVGLRVDAGAGVVLRASYGTGFLPPNATQLVPSVPTTSNLTSILDPRRGLTVVGPVTTAGGGNPDLNPEKSESWSAGIIFTPKPLKGLRASLDWVRIEKTDNIAGLNFQQLLDNEAILPGRVIRGPNLSTDPSGWAGPVTNLITTLVNLSTTKVEAWDAALDYQWNSASVGRIDVFAAATWTTSFISQVVPTAAPVELAGISTNNPLKFKANAGITWKRNAWTVGWTTQHFAAYQIAANPTTTGAVTVANQGALMVPAQTYHDVFVAYNWGSGSRSDWRRYLSRTEVRLGVRNVLNAKPPFVAISPFYSTFGDPRLPVYEVSVKKNI